MFQKRIIKRLSQTLEIERTDGTFHQLTISELSPKKADEAFEALFDLALKYHIIKKAAALQITGDEKTAENLFDDIDYQSALRDQPVEFWRLITEKEDVSWIDDVYGSGLAAAMQVFEEVNPCLQGKRGLLEQIAILSEQKAGDQ
jgi:hypothetical protein